MKVRELIEALQKLDADLDVLVDGYEFGQQEVTRVEQTEYVVDYWGDADYGGPHQIKSSAMTEDGQVILGCVLLR